MTLLDSGHQPSPPSVASFFSDGSTQLQPSESRHRDWSTREIAVLRELYPSGGARSCATFLPGRSIDAIRLRARKEGLVSAAPRPAQGSGTTTTQPPQSEWVDQQIIAVYQGKFKHGDVRALATTIGRTDKWVYNRAVELGLTRPRTKPEAWSKAEVDILQCHKDYGLSGIQSALAKHGYQRSRAAIKQFILRHMPDEDLGANVMSGNEIARLMGTTPATVYRWINKLDLRAKYRADGEKTKYLVTARTCAPGSSRTQQQSISARSTNFGSLTCWRRKSAGSGHPSKDPTRNGIGCPYHGIIMTTQLILHTQAAPAANQFNVFWTTGRKQGIVEVTISEKETQDQAIIAELSAMHYLLSHKEICGCDRAGNGMEIAVTFGAIRKIAQNTSNKKHLFAHGRFLLTRYAEAKISVSKDSDWIRLARAENRREQLLIDEPLPEVIQVSGIGKVGLSFHIIDRMMERANYSSIGAAWRHLCRMLGGGKVSEVTLPTEVAHHKAAKHGSVGKHLRVASEPWRFVLSNGNRGYCGSLPMLVTAYVRA